MVEISGIKRLDEVDIYTALGGTVKIFTQALGCQQMELAIGLFMPGEGLKRHYHHSPSEEIYYVYRGEGTVYRGDETLHVTGGMALYVPPGVEHGLQNTGTGPLEIVFVTAPIQREPMAVVE